MTGAVVTSAASVKALREATGAGMMECKRALAESGGSMEAAKDRLRKKGLASAEKRAGRTASEGTVAAYVHMGRIGTLAEIRCETDFVARTPEFQAFARAVAMHVAAQAPRFLRREDVPGDALARERAIHLEEAAASGKPPQVVEKIVAGKMEKFFGQACLLDQALVVPVDGIEDGTTVGEAVKLVAAKVGEKVEVARVARMALGES